MPKLRATTSVLLAGALVIAACGDDDDEDTTSDTTAAAAPTTTAGGAAEPATTTDGAAPTTGASALPEETGPADESLEPVVIGWMNIDDGVPSFPATTEGFVAGMEYATERLGGIDGRPIEVRTCSVGLDDASIQQCAQQFANDDAVTLVATGYVINAGGPHYPIFESAGMPVNLQTPLQQPDLTTDIGVSYFPGNPGISAGLPYFLATYQDAQSIAVVVSDNDAGRGAIQLIEQLGEVNPEMADVEITPVFVSDDEVDLTGPIRAAGADQADAFLPLVAASGCIQVANALDSLGIDVPVASTGLCAAQEVQDAVGEKIEGWFIGFSGTPPFLGPGVDDELDLFLEVYPEYGDEALQFGASASQGFGQALALWEVGNGIGADGISRDAWLEAMRTFEGPVFMGPREISCPGPVFPSVCGGQSRVYQYTADGFVDATDGEAIDPFAG